MTPFRTAFVPFIVLFTFLCFFFYGETIERYLNWGYTLEEANIKAIGNTFIKAFLGSFCFAVIVYVIARYRADNPKSKEVKESIPKPSKESYKRSIIWTHKEYTLTQPQKAIWSTTVLLLGLVITISALSYSKYYTLSDITESNFILILAFIAIEAYLQLKLWSETFRFKYPTGIAKTKEVSGETPPFLNP